MRAASLAVWVASRLAATDTATATGAGSAAGRAWAGVLGVTLAQGVVGYTQYVTGLPWVVVLVHMLLATLLVVALTRAMVRLRSTT